MEENEKSYNIVSLIGKLFGSLESTDLVGRQLGKMRLVYELNQANRHFSQILEDAKKKPQLGLDNIDEMRSIVDGCKAPTDSRLLTGNVGGTKSVIDYLLPALEKYGPNDMPVDFTQNLRSAIDKMVMHVAFTDTVMNTAINDGVENLSKLLGEIDTVLRKGNWPDESYCKFAEDALKRCNNLTIGADKDIQKFGEQMEHEDEITEEYLDDILKDKQVEFLRSDFADTSWCSFSKSALTRKCGNMKDCVIDCKDSVLLMENMNVCASVMENDGKMFVFKPTVRLGKYLYKHKDSYSQKVKQLFDYFKFVVVIERERRKIKMQEEGVEIVNVDDNADVLDEEVTANSGIRDNADLFLHLLKNMDVGNFTGKTWLLVFSIAMNHPRIGYDGTLKDFHNKVIKGITGCDIGYNGVNTSLKRELSEDAEIRKNQKNMIITKYDNWSKEPFVQGLIKEDKNANNLLHSIDDYFWKKCNEVING